jgi:prolipoprotein diacylglyceryl transferase
MLSFITWNANPTAFTIPGLNHEIRWYGLLFALGFALGAWFVWKQWKNEKLNSVWYDKLFFYVIISAAIGARLGHVLFYNPEYYLAHPVEIFKTWEGGLASHGGVIGIIIAVWIYSRRVTHKNMLWTLDRLVVPVGFVAAFIRTGNLMNSEIYGHPTSMSWGFRFIRDPEWYQAPILAQPCHPTQIYEALCYILTSVLCMWMYWKRKDYNYQGLIFGVFMIGIFLARFIIEFFKNNQVDFESDMFLNMGQILSIPFILVGVWFMYKGLQTRKADNPIKK